VVCAMQGQAVAAVLCASGAGAALAIAGIKPFAILAWHGIEAAIRSLKDRPPGT